MSGQANKRPQFLAAFAASIGAFSMGMALGWSAPTQKQIVDESSYGFVVTESDFSWVGSLVPLGAAVACLPTGFLVDIIGRKNTMLYSAIPFVVGWILLVWPNGVTMLVIGRFITGFCGGIFCVAAPMYITEMSQKNIRGLLSSFYQLFITIGVETSYIIGAFVSVFWLSIICTLMPIAFAVLFFFMPETPQYHLKCRRIEEAKTSLQWFRGDNYNCESDLEDMKEELEESSKNQASFLQMFTNKIARKGLLIMAGIMALQQLSGINAVVFYANDIFADAGSSLDPRISTIIVGAVLSISTVPATMIVDIAGRKLLLFISAIVMSISIIILGFYFLFKVELASVGWLPLGTLVIFFIFFSIGAGPVAWIMGAELFAPEIKGPAMALSGFFNWILAFLVTKFYGDMVAAFYNYSTFWFFGVCSALGAAHVYFFTPETKGKTTEEILKELE